MPPDALRPRHERPEEQHERSEKKLRQRLAPGGQVVAGPLGPLVPELHPKLERDLVLPLPVPPAAPSSCCRRFPTPVRRGAPAVQQDVQALLPGAHRPAGLACVLPRGFVAELEHEVPRPGLVEQAGGGGGGGGGAAAAATAAPPASRPPPLQRLLFVLWWA